MDILLCSVAHAGLVHIGLSRWSLVRGHGSVILSPSEMLVVRDIGLGGVDEEWLMWVLSSTLRPWLMVRQRTVVARPGTHAEL